MEISDLNLQSQGRPGWKPHVVIKLCCWRFSLEQSPYSLLFYEALACSERGIGLLDIGSRFLQKVEGWPPKMDLMGYRFVEGNSTSRIYPTNLRFVCMRSGLGQLKTCLIGAELITSAVYRIDHILDPTELCLPRIYHNWWLQGQKVCPDQISPSSRPTRQEVSPSDGQ